MRDKDSEAADLESKEKIDMIRLLDIDGAQKLLRQKKNKDLGIKEKRLRDTDFGGSNLSEKQLQSLTEQLQRAASLNSLSVNWTKGERAAPCSVNITGNEVAMRKARHIATHPYTAPVRCRAHVLCACLPVCLSARVPVCLSACLCV